jgi:hypothetical protein
VYHTLIFPSATRAFVEVAPLKRPCLNVPSSTGSLDLFENGFLVFWGSVVFTRVFFSEIDKGFRGETEVRV